MEKLNISIKISIIIPVFNEEGNIPILVERHRIVLQEYHWFEIVFVDDGSSDDTLPVVKSLHETDKRIKYLSFSRNFGHQAAYRDKLIHPYSIKFRFFLSTGSKSTLSISPQ